MKIQRFLHVLGPAAAALALASPAFGGPPFASDDPEPTDPGHWEIYGFNTGTHMAGETEGESGFDINYGAAPNLQLTAVTPIAYVSDAHPHAGVGKVELAVKYRFLHQSEGSLLPDLAVFPRVFLPTAGANFGTKRLGILLPLWGQKDIGRWSLFGGGGYMINPGPGQRNSWMEGLAVSHPLGDRLTLGGEIYHHSPDEEGSRAFTGFNLGGQYQIDSHWALLASAGHGGSPGRQQGQYSYYASIKAMY